MEASGAGQTADQGADETPVGDAPTAEPTASEVPSPSGNGIVVVCGIFEPGSVVELVERGPRDVRPGGSSAVRGRRTVDGEGEVGFAGLIPGDLFFVTGYVDGEFRPIRCVAQDPSSSMTLLQPPEQALPGQQGTAQTPVVEEPPAEPATATEGEGLPEGVTSPVLGTGDAQPQRYYLHNIEEEPDAAIWRKANVREQVVPADESRTPNDLWVYAGSEEPVELGSDWTPYEGPTEPVPPADEAAPDTAAEASAASSADATGPAQATADGTAVDSTTTAPAGEQGADTEAGGSPATTETASETSQAADPAASDSGTAPAGQEAAQAVTAAAAEDAGATVGDQAAGEAAVQVVDKLVKQAEGLGVPNAAALSDAELRQSISEKSATPVV
jgi:nicotinate-nucleotide--dimethylbenzimidazole phosphoribosyltransferase